MSQWLAGDKYLLRNTSGFSKCINNHSRKQESIYHLTSQLVVCRSIRNGLSQLRSYMLLNGKLQSSFLFNVFWGNEYRFHSLFVFCLSSKRINRFCIVKRHMHMYYSQTIYYFFFKNSSNRQVVDTAGIRACVVWGVVNDYRTSIPLRRAIFKH